MLRLIYPKQNIPSPKKHITLKLYSSIITQDNDIQIEEKNITKMHTSNIV